MAAGYRSTNTMMFGMPAEVKNVRTPFDPPVLTRPPPQFDPPVLTRPPPQYATIVGGGANQPVPANGDPAMAGAAATDDGLSWREIAQRMMSGEAMAPYTESMREAATRMAANQRGNVGALISRGMSQAAARQMSQATEGDIRRSRMESILNQGMAKENLKQQGAGLAMRGEELESQKAYREGQLELGRGQLQLDREKMMQYGELQRESMGLQRAELSLEAKKAQDYIDFQMGRLDLDTELGRGRLELEQAAQESDLDYRNRRLELEQTIADRDYDIANRAQQWQEDYGTSHLAIQSRLAELNASRLNNEKKWAAQDLAYRYEALSQNDRLAMAQIDLGGDELTSADRRFLEQLGLSRDAQNWIEEFQTQTIELERERFESDKEEREKERKEREEAREEAREESTSASSKYSDDPNAPNYWYNSPGGRRSRGMEYSPTWGWYWP